MGDKNYTHIKANGLRNELKEVRKSIDKLTNVLIEYNKHTHNEKDIIDCSNAFCSMHVCKCTGKTNCN